MLTNITFHCRFVKKNDTKDLTIKQITLQHVKHNVNKLQNIKSSVKTVTELVIKKEP